jgi:hypothetical protein
LKNVINKACKVFCTCKGTFSKTWGLKPKVSHLIYIMIIRPILTNGSTEWWTRVNYNVSKMEVNKLQRLACLAVTGEMKTTTRAAMKVHLGLLPLHVITEMEALVGIYRLMCNQRWRPTSTNYVHAKKSWDMEQGPILLKGTDRMTPRYVFHKPLKIHLSYKHE